MSSTKILDLSSTRNLTRYFRIEVIMLQRKKEVNITSAEGLTFKNETPFPVSATKEINDRNRFQQAALKSQTWF
jgi:hypothetical protein